jgi:hypothetical protein
MIAIRYYVEHLPAGSDPHHPSQRSSAHPYCREHHWLRIDEDTIVGIGHFRSGAHVTKANATTGVTVLPHLHDATPIKSLLPANKHAKLKAKFNLNDSDSTSDFVGKLLAAGHAQFEPPI